MNYLVEFVYVVSVSSAPVRAHANTHTGQSCRARMGMGCDSK